MPGLVRKFLVFAAVDGLILQPYGNAGSRNSAGRAAGSEGASPASTPIQIEYKTRRIYSISPVSAVQQQPGLPCLESHGVVGLLSVASYSFLISITRKEQVAQILGKPIFVITGVAIIPLSSRSEASKAIEQARRSFKEDVQETAAESDSSSFEEETDDEADSSSTIPPDPEFYPPVEEPVNEGSTVAEDVIQKRGLYGRFGTRWFSRRGWERQKRLSQGMSREDAIDSDRFTGRRSSDVLELDNLTESGTKSPPVSPQNRPSTDNATPEEETQAYELTPKLLRFTKMIIGSRSFYFSYDYDITRRFGRTGTGTSPLPLFRQVDPLYFWNRHLMKPLVESGHHGFVLPLMQGFIDQREFLAEPLTQTEQKADELRSDINDEQTTPGTDTRGKFLLTLISRRSIKRSGVRYLRRGVDDEGNAANSVETEQILSTPSWDSKKKVYSLLQLRGSIPLYFSQSPYYFKPVPVLRHSTQTNQASFDKHFRDIGRRYGKAKAVCLLDKHGVEVKIGETYEKLLDNFNKSGGANGTEIGFEWFDFHNECRGMKFENVRRLVAAMTHTLDSFGDTVVQDNEVLQTQSGVIRTNCMDCLDRTGVAQCAFAQYALERQLREEGYTIDLQTSISTQWFNILWADNGDAISKQYSSTAALKGDYTRTRKRDYRGALNDLGLTLSRYYNNIVTDYFSQACIDYLLGVVTTRVFDEFEMHLESADPGISLEKVRQNAIETSCQIVISDDTEELVGGWTMLSPRQPNTLRTLPFEQSVLLLTNAAVYCCRFDWNAEKVTSFERIDLRSITSINYGTYVTSTLTEAQMDEKKNVGLVIAYRPGGANMLRVNTRSMQSLFEQNSEATKDSTSDWDLLSLFKGPSRPPTQFIAFKLPPHGTSVTKSSLNEVSIGERDAVRAICEDIERTALRGDGDGGGHVEDESTLLKETEIISSTEARKRTGFMEHLVFDIKRLVWA